MFCIFEIVEVINIDECENHKSFHNIRKVIVDGFVNYDAHKILDSLNLFDLLRLVIENQDVDRVLDVDTDNLRENKFQLVKVGKHNTCFAVNELVYT